MQRADIPALADAANDALIWEQHPSKDRADKALFIPYAETLIDAGGAVVFVKINDERIIGCSRFYRAPNETDAWAIGFTFIEREFWGRGVNKTLKSLMINHIFETHDRVWLHIDPGNIRSQKATEKLGAYKAAEIVADVLNTNNNASYFCYLLTKANWHG